jgi:hypothetical protein
MSVSGSRAFGDIDRAHTPRLAGVRRSFAGLLMIFTGLVAAGPSAYAAALPGQFLGQAESIEAQAVVGPLSLGLGASAQASCPCAGTNGKTTTNSMTTLSVGPGGSLASGTVNTSTSYGVKTSTHARTQQTSLVTNLSLLNGLITADAVEAVATADATPTALTTSHSGSMLTNLVVAGVAINADVPANTVVALPGVGSVTVKFVATGAYANQAVGLEVEMLRVQVTESNSLGLPVGAVLVVAEAYAGYNRVQPAASLGGYAETLAVTTDAGALLQEAASAGAFSGIGACSGTDGATLSSSVANISAGSLLTLEGASTSAFAGPVSGAQVAKTSSTLANVSLLGGLITATSISSVAQESLVGSTSTPSTLGTNFGDLVIAGVSVSANVPANTVVSLPGVGYVVVNEQPAPANGQLQVNGLHIVVNVANSLGLPVGVEIFVSHAQASATKF